MSQNGADLLCGTEVSIAWAKEQIEKACGNVAKIIDGKAAKIAVGQGFLSDIVRFEIQWSSEGLGLPKSVILKIPTVRILTEGVELLANAETAAATRQLVADFLPMAHANECSVYNLLGAAPPCPIPHPLAVYLDQPPVLILQDLSAETVTVRLSDGLTLAQTKEIVQALASLHAFSLAREDIQSACALRHHTKQMLATWFASFDNSVRQLVQLKPEWFSEQLFDKIRYIADLDYAWVHWFQSARLANMPEILVHGDLWTNNILFYRSANDGGASDKLAALLDWQLARWGAPTDDLARLFVTSCSVAMRRGQTEHLLEHYYKTLVLKMAPKKPPFQLVDVLRTYSISLPIAALNYVITVPLMLQGIKPDEPDRERRVGEILGRCKAVVEELAASS